MMKTNPISRILCMLVVLASLFLCACPATPPDGGGTTTTTTPATITGGGGLPPATPTATLTASAPYAAAEDEGITLTAACEGTVGNWQFTYPDGIIGIPKSANTAQIFAERAGIYTIKATNGEREATCTVNFYDPAGTYTADNTLIKYVGRTEASGTNRLMHMATAGFEVAFYGKTLKMSLLSSHIAAPKAWGEGGEVHYSVFVDGETDPSARVLYVAEELNGTPYTVVSFDEVGYHRVRLQRRSEIQFGYNTLVSLQVEDGGLLPVPAADAGRLKIEAYGDSITAGFGCLRNPGVTDNVDVKAASALHTYAALAAQSLGADYQAVAISGVGLRRSPLNNASDSYSYHLKNFYNKAYPASASLFPATDYVPDVIVINIGTNDISGVAAQVYDAGAFRDAYIGLVRGLVARYAGHEVSFFLCTGLMDTALAAPVGEAVATLTAEGVSVTQIAFNRTAEAGHPSSTEHQAAAATLATAIRNTLGITE